MKIYLIGAGLGNPDTMTLEARRAIEECPVLIGAPRLLAPWPGKRCIALIAAAQIAQAIEELDTPCAGVLLSGDVGFYSGAKNLYPLLTGHQVVTIPGVSSVQYLCAKCQTPWQDVHLISAHGRAHNAPGEIQSHSKSFVLTGGDYRAGDLCAALTEWGMADAEVTVGERLSYPEERIVRGTAGELAGQAFDSLSAVLVCNPHPIRQVWAAPGLEDDAFARDKVPMTKAEIRALVIAKLRIEAHHTVWDVGAGTGSVSAECAYAAREGRVYAVERKPEAVALLEKNKARLGLTNLFVVPGTAPQALESLPGPDRVFLGGTAGNMERILALALEKNPAARIVATAVTLETIAEALRCFAAFKLDAQVVQVAVTRTRRVGDYHMMDAQNPVWIVTGEARHAG